jgi:peptidoglycan/LPS O-acetylase OafA/YrhL
MDKPSQVKPELVHPLTHPTYRPDIDGLRAVAVLLVVFHHAFPPLLPGGFIGVDLFFVISGFLISTIIFQNLEQNTFSFLDFYKRRVKRIFPALCLVLLASFACGWFVLLPADYKQLGKHMAAGAAFVSNFAFWNESGYFDSGSKLKPLLHLWSLGIEEQYYIFWPLIAWFLWKRQINLFKVCVALFAVSFIINIATAKGNPVAAFYSPASRFWELLVGSMLAYIKLHALNWRQLAAGKFSATMPTERTSSSKADNVTACAGILILALGVYFINPERRFPGFWALFPTIAAFLLIKAGPKAWFNHVVLSNRLFVWVGLISFPLYLWHWPLLVFAEIKLGTLDAITKLGLVALSILLSWLTYRFVERPIRFGKLVVETKKIPLALCTVLLATAILGGYTYQRDGFGFRFPKFIQALLHNQPKLDEGWRSGTCILDQGHPSSEFSPDCVDKIADNTKRPLLFLWGDSHAAALYPGLKHLQDTGAYNFGVAQRTAAVCPPIIGDARPWCNEINTSSFKLIQELKPEIVMMYAYWSHGLDGKGGFAGLYDLSKLDATVAELKKAGVKKVVLMGPSPYWKNSLPHNIVETWKKAKTVAKPPLYMSYGDFGLVAELPIYDKQMREIAKRLDISYISGLDFLCNADGCLTRDSEDGVKVASVDYGHLTVDAAQTYLKRIAPLIFAPETVYSSPQN